MMMKLPMQSILVYGAEIWTMTKFLKKQLNGCYTQRFRMTVFLGEVAHQILNYPMSYQS